MIMPPCFLFGTYGISEPICHSTELIADFLDEPVPTISPTKASGWPCLFSSAIFSNAPGILLTNMALACNGMSGRLQASEAGDKSSVFISPGTLKNAHCYFFGQGIASGKPFSIGPGINDLFCLFVFFRFAQHIMKRIEY